MEIKKNTETIIEITGTTHDGSGVGRIGDFVVFVPNCAEGETVKVHILSVKKNLAYAKVLEIVKPSPKRIEPDCNSYIKCGGCAFRHISYDEELRLKYNRVCDAFRKFSGVTLKPEEILASPKTDNYRNKAQYPVGKNKDGRVIAGFYAPHSHRIVECENCNLQPQSFASILNEVISWANEYKIEPYDERTGNGILRHIFIRKAFTTGQTMLCLVINAKPSSLPHTKELISKVTSTAAEVCSIVLNVNNANTNSIMGKTCTTIYGSETITDVLGDVKFEISPLSFYQVNSVQALNLYSIAADFANLNGSETLLDMYCGTGTIGLFMAKKAKSLIGVEIISQAVENAKRNAKINGIENARFICGDSGKAAEQLLSEKCCPDVVVVDPPRKGCDLLTVDSISSMNPKRIVYVSCDPATLARDVKLFTERGYSCERIKPVDMFPRTHHVETVVLMSKVR
jgi:23S rRNA (uracil1939-C5)-methyltransferase